MKIKEKIQELEKEIEELKKEAQKEAQKEEMKEWFKSLLNGLEIGIDDNHPDSLHYKKNGEIFFVLYQSLEKTYFYCNHKLVWSIFKEKYKLNYYEIQAFIRGMVEQYLKLSNVTPVFNEYVSLCKVEQYLKLGGVRPNW
jgi:predicted nuclease with TOPRIM domain